jgi:hypothetical protein
LKRLVQTHPSPKISRDLNGMIERGDVFLNFQDDMMRTTRGVATVQYINTPSHGLVLTLMVSADALLDPNQTDAFKQLVIYHEYIHIEQQRDGRIPKRQLYARRADVPLTEEEMRFIFKAESEAYEEECRLAVELHMESAFGLCVSYAKEGALGMRLDLAASYALVPVFARHTKLLAQLARSP